MAKLPVTVSVSVSGENVHISFPTQGATSYQVLYKQNLTDANWQLLTTVDGDGTTKTVLDPVGTGRLYRVNTL